MYVSPSEGPRFTSRLLSKKKSIFQVLLAGVEKKIWQMIVAAFVCDCTSGHSVQTDEPPTV